MMPAVVVRLAGVLALAPLADAAIAARPFVTDDARIVDRGGCQIETYAKRQRTFGENETWFLPACNPWGWAELTAGGQRTDNFSEGTSSALIVQAKTLLKRLEANAFGWAVTLGGVRQSSFETTDRARWSPFFNLVGSRSFGDTLVVHANAGARDDRLAGSTLYTWGLGAEVALTSRLSGIAEAYGEERQSPSRQVGARYWIVPDRLQVDGTLGAQSDDPQDRKWVSVGLRALF
jgi:hypothetical protein